MSFNHRPFPHWLSNYQSPISTSEHMRRRIHVHKEKVTKRKLVSVIFERNSFIRFPEVLRIPFVRNFSQVYILKRAQNHKLWFCRVVLPDFLPTPIIHYHKCHKHSYHQFLASQSNICILSLSKNRKVNRAELHYISSSNVDSTGHFQTCQKTNNSDIRKAW